MSKNKGWIKLHRNITDHWIYQEKPFSKFQAWLDLCMMANHDDRKILLGNELVEVQRGSFITSELILMNRWGWSKTKIRNFLELLENDCMLVKKADTKKTTLTIVNYSDYQDIETTEKPEKDQEKTTKEPQENYKETTKRHKQELKNYKELYKDIVEYLNEKTGRGFSTTSKSTTAKIHARLEEGFTSDDFKRVIDIKSSEWLDDAKMQKYLRPETLFGTKFEGYLNEKGVKGGVDIGQCRTNSGGASEETLRLERIAKEQGLIRPDGSVEEPGEVDF